MKIKNYKTPISNYGLPNHIESLLFYLLILFIPTQLGKHYWPDFSYILGIRVDYLSPTIYLTDVLIVLLAVGWLFRNLSSVKREELRAKGGKFQISNFKYQISNIKRIGNWKFAIGNYWILILFVLLNILFSNRIESGLYSLLKTLEMAFVAYYTAKFVINRNLFQKVITVLGIGTICESVLAIAQYFTQGSIGGVLYYLGERTFNASTPGIANASLNGELVLRPYGTLPHPNVLAGYLLVVMTLILFSFGFRKPKQESRSKKQESWIANRFPGPLILNSYFLIHIAALVLGTTALILSMSRVGIALWVMALGYTFLKLSFRAKSRNLFSFSLLGTRSLHAFHLVGMTCVGLGIAFLLSPIGSRFTNINIHDEAVTQRAVLVGASIKMVQSSPLLGVGLGNFLPTLAAIQKPLTASTYLQPVHNIFLLVAAETGLIGLSIFLWFLWKTFKAANGKWQMANGISVCFFAIIITGFFDHYWLTLQQGQVLFAVIIGFCWIRPGIKPQS